MPEPSHLHDQDWDRAYRHLQIVRHRYVDIGAEGVPGLHLTLDPLLVRYFRGERTVALYEAILATE